MSEIWAQADIAFSLQHIGGIDVSYLMFQDIALDIHERALRAFVNDVQLPIPGAINVFFVQKLWGQNGQRVPDEPTVLVIDNPFISAKRVASHEVGHFLGLKHLSDSDSLMFTAVLGAINGTKLAQTEIKLARTQAATLP